MALESLSKHLKPYSTLYTQYTITIQFTLNAKQLTTLGSRYVFLIKKNIDDSICNFFSFSLLWELSTFHSIYIFSKQALIVHVCEPTWSHIKTFIWVEFSILIECLWGFAQVHQPTTCFLINCVAFQIRI